MFRVTVTGKLLNWHLNPQRLTILHFIVYKPLGINEVFMFSPVKDGLYQMSLEFTKVVNRRSILFARQ
jgi:hypothetical protein